LNGEAERERVDNEVGARFWRDKSVFAVRISHHPTFCDLRHRVHFSVPVQKLSEKGQVIVRELLRDGEQLGFGRLRDVPPIHKAEGSFLTRSNLATFLRVEG